MVLSVNNRRGRFELRADQLKEITSAFNLLDSAGTGKIDYHELKVAMRGLGFDVKKQEVLDLITKYDKTNSGYIDFDNFKDIMSRKFSEREPMDEINRAFELFDKDKKGHDLSDDDLQAMIEEFDNDRDGAISKEDFIGIMKQTSLY